MRSESEEFTARTMRLASMRLREPVRRDRDGNLAWLRLDHGGESENGAVSEPAQESKNDKKANQTRHVAIHAAAAWSRSAARGTVGPDCLSFVNAMCGGTRSPGIGLDAQCQPRS